VSLSELSLHDVWLRYLELSGTHTLKEFHAYVYHDAVWSAHENNVAAQALNDYFVDHGLTTWSPTPTSCSTPRATA
jgi:hypothetical protein